MQTARQTFQENFNIANIESQTEIKTSLLNFCAKMGSAFEIKDFLFTLKSQIPKKIKTGELLLFYESDILGLRRAYIKNNLFYEESAKNPWPPSPVMSLNNSQQSFYLANELGKPFSKTFVLPLSPHQKQIELQIEPALLFIEMGNWKKDLEPLKDFFQKRRLILNLIFKRVCSNTHFNRISYLWSQLFMSWEEPLGLLQNFQPLRTNKAFKKDLLKTRTFFSKKTFWTV